jgi:drug/metabolite transporter (DMT)-like permease
MITNICLLVTGQLIWKTEIANKGGINFTNLFSILFLPKIVLGLFIYAIATLIWFFILSRMPISIAYPLQSLAYLLILLLSHFFLNEAISINRWIGAAIIVFGVVVLSWK